MIEIKIGNEWRKLRILDKDINPEFFRVDWDDFEPLFVAVGGASLNKTQEVFRFNGDTRVKCGVTVSKYPHMEPGCIVFATVTMTPASGGEQ